MRAGMVLAMSAVLHGAALAVLAWWWVPAPEVELPPSVAYEPPAVVTVDLSTITPLEVDLVPVAATGTGAVGRTERRAASGQRVTTSRPEGPPPETRAPEPGTGTSTGTGKGKDWMHPRPAGMRGEPSNLEGIAAGGPPLPPPVRESGRVESAPGGKAVIHDTVTTIAIDRDGTAHFHDEPDVDIHLSPLLHAFGSFTELRHGLGAMIDQWYADPYATVRGGRFEDLPPDQKAVPGECDHWGDCAMAVPSPPQGRLPETATAPIAGGKMDITGWLMRKTVGDPYASRKRALLDSSVDERAARGGAFRVEQLDHSAELMHRNLVQLWASVRDPVARRQALFEIWDECAEGDGPLGEAGQRARAEVIGWIRARMPEGYPPAELATLNAHRQSVQPFEP